MKKKLLAFFLVAAMLVSVTACGTSGSTAGSTGGSGSTAGGGLSAPDQDFVIAFNNDIQSLDPHNNSDTLSITVARTMYEGLVAFDENQQIIPQLAESYEAADDHVTYTFHLRQGVKFHDGEEFNAAAFVANYERALGDETLRQYRRVSTWESVETPDDYTVVITLKTPNSSFLNQFTQFNIISPKLIEQGTSVIAKSPVGTGPYTFTERVEGDHVTLAPNADYWGGAPSVNSVTFRAVPEDGSRVAMLQTGEADYIYPMPAIQASSMDGTDNIEVITMPSNVMRYVTLNTTLPQLSDVRVRQAMNYAIDKQAYIKTVFNGYAEEVYSAYPSSVQYYSAQTPYDFNLEKAKELMAEAGYADGFKITIWGDNTTQEQKGMQFVQQQLAQIGIEMEVLPMEPNTIGDMIYVEKDEATIETWYVNWSASSFDADGSMRNILYSEMMPPASANTAYYNNPEFDRLLDEGREATDPDQLAEIYADAQAIVWEDCPWLFLGNDQVMSGQKTYVSGVSLRPDGSLEMSKLALA